MTDPTLFRDDVKPPSVPDLKKVEKVADPQPKFVPPSGIQKYGAEDIMRESGHPVVVGRPGYIGAYSPQQRKLRIEKFFEKRNSRIWTKKVKYDVRKNFADSRLRVKVF